MSRTDPLDGCLQHTDFFIGREFWTETGHWRCTDVGTRTICAIHLEPLTRSTDQPDGTFTKSIRDDPSWFNGPPYAVAEYVFDENSFGALYISQADVMLADLADDAKRAADSTAAAVDDAIDFVNESNLRIAALERAPKSPLWRVVEAQAIAELTLHVRFADGVHGTVKFEITHLTGVFEVLKDPKFFRQVRVEFGVVTWPGEGELDLAPDAMYDEIKAHGVWVLR